MAPLINNFLVNLVNIDGRFGAACTFMQPSNTGASPITIPVVHLGSVGEDWGNVSHIAKNGTYYIPSGDIVFLVDKQLFRVHRYFLVREPVEFRNTLSAISSCDMGTSDARPIPLTNVTADEFESFLWIFYNDVYGHYDAPLEKWVAILRLAHMWRFPKVKTLATQKLDELNIEPVDKAVMARDYEVDSVLGWQEEAFAAIGARHDPISKSEGEKLGLDTVLALSELRERIREERHEKERIKWHQGDGASPIAKPSQLPSSPHRSSKQHRAPSCDKTLIDNSHAKLVRNHSVLAQDEISGASEASDVVPASTDADNDFLDDLGELLAGEITDMAVQEDRSTQNKGKKAGRRNLKGMKKNKKK